MNDLEDTCKKAERDRRLNSQKQTATNHCTKIDMENTKLGNQRQPNTTTSSKRETTNAVSPDKRNTQQTDEVEGNMDHFTYTVRSSESTSTDTGKDEWNITAEDSRPK